VINGGIRGLAGGRKKAQRLKHDLQAKNFKVT
jgi:hypothetical protein